ncbi:sushi domain-containing protein 1 isoform X3 [Erpetoichthys calabaricus]|uniref:sushi domain-containing protein 1 isoform X3 n=1 Tax=Erpetoichthys calabaricus TaxID=27687 RepID=UPI002234C8B8|nr:sushi domain-containing protein 1 isoform X3 [Erpetoichthys calabaricus]
MNGVPELPRSAGAATAVLLLLASLQVQKVQMLITTPPDICATCHENATCSEKEDGSGKICICMYGLIGNGRTYCQDKDECKISSLICGEHTVCHNTYGSFYCTCLDGYRPSSNTELFIPNDGTHCEDINECDNQEICGDGGFCHNFNGSYNCTCQEGYSVQNGSEPFIRHVGGPYCRAVDCGMLPIVKDAVAPVASTTTYKSAVRYTCQKGTVWKSGNNTAICMATGMWGGPTLVCKEIDCGRPPAVAHATIVWTNGSRLGSVAHYQCNPGYHSVGGRNYSMCGLHGLWEEASLSCNEMDCGPPAVHPGATAWWNSTRPGSLAIYQCMRGHYEAGGKNFSTCLTNGSWDNASLLCKEIDCGPPPSVLHASVVWTNGSRLDSVAHYQCSFGYHSIGGRTYSKCGMRGIWDEVSLSCNGESNISLTEWKYQHGFPSCVVSDLTCLNLRRPPKYEPEITSVKVPVFTQTSTCFVETNCGPPAVHPGTTTWWNNTRPGSVAIYQCIRGHSVVGGKNFSTCLTNGSWDNASLLCKEMDCGPPPVVSHASAIWDGSTRLGSVVFYECKEGFRHVGERNFTVCTVDGDWENISLVCEEIYCKVPHLIQNANLLWDGSRHPGSLASYQCKEGFYFKGSKNFSICNLRGIWDSISGECKEIDCGPPPSLPNITPLWNDTLDLRYGAVVYYRCTEGFYHAGGDNFSMCAANGLWQMTSLLCKEINCGKPASIPHATVLWNQASQLGSKVYYKCQDGFFTHSKNNYSMCAADGKWGQLNFTCIEIDCGIAPSLANAAMTASNGTVLGSVAHYQCNEGFINMGGTNVSICTGQGKWLLATLICDGIKEASPVISDLVIFDEKCIKWNAQRDRRANETYKLHLKGLRVYQEGFLEEIVTNFTSSEDSPELCLNLHPGTNYSLHITALSTGISTQAFLSTEIGDPGVPEIVFPIAEDPLPSFTFRKMADINGPISLYQVIVASQDRSLDFDCGSHNIPNFYSQDENEQIYLAAEFHAEDLSEEVVFLIGDRRFFGEYYNAPLDKSRAYVIILRVISEWKQVQKQSCVFWVQTKGPSYTTQHITILAVGSGVLVAFFVFLGNSFVWYCGKKYPCG